MEYSFKRLVVWQKAMDLVALIDKLTGHLPSHERYGLCSQIRRASVSIPSNIAEGYKRKGLGEYIQFLKITDASCAEVETQMLLIKRLYPDIQLQSSFSFPSNPITP